MSRETELIRREFLAKKEFLVGTVVGAKRPVRFDGTAPGAAVVWVCDVEIGSNNPLLNVPIKGGSDGGRFFAELGNIVLLRRNLLGRYQVMGPGDRCAGERATTEYNLVTQDVAASSRRGFSIFIDPFEFYQGPTAMLGNPSVTFTNTGGNDTLDRSTGSFVDDGFLAGQSVRVANSPLNAGLYTILTVTIGTLDFAGDPFVDEGPISGVTMGVAGSSRWNGLSGFPSKRIIDAAGNTIQPS